MKVNTNVSCVWMLFPKNSYPPVRMLADICPYEKSTIKRLHIYLLCLLLWKVEISLFLSQSVPFLPAFFPNCSSCLSSSCCMDQFWPTSSASHHVLGWSWLFFLSSATQQRLLFLYQSFHPRKGSMSISISLLLLSFHLWKRSVNTSTS